MQKDRDGEITKEKIEELKKRIGVTWKPTKPYYNTTATSDNIRKFCEGIGDTNPLFCNAEYGKNSNFRGLVAPPSFLYSVYWPAQGRGMPGIHAWHSGDDWEFYQPILENDELTYTNTLVDVKEKKSKMAGITLIQYHEIVYFNQRAEIVAKSLDWCVRAGRYSAAKKGKYKDIPKAKYTSEEMQEIFNAYDNEEIRGAKTRFWEDVNVGDELTPVVKGPLSLRDIIAWLMGAGSPFLRAHTYAYAFLKKHPGTDMVDSTSGEIDVPELVHMQESRAEGVGVPGAYDYGCQRMSWLCNLLTNWMGDHGFLKKMKAELRRFNVVGDTTWLKGKVTSKYVKDNEHLVDIECWGENQRAEITMPGSAIVRLQSKNK
jgi:acyl dehydratase